MQSFYDVISSQDGGAAFIGKANGGLGYTDIWVGKTDQNGDTIWSILIEYVADDRGNQIIQLPNGEYVFNATRQIGISSQDNILVRIDQWGNEVWTKVMHPFDEMHINHMDTLPDNQGFIFAGNAKVGPGVEDDAVVFATDTLGNVTWAKSWGTPNGNQIRWIKKLDTGGFIATGSWNYTSFGSDGKGILLRLDSSGDTLWTRDYGMDTVLIMYSNFIDSDGNYLLAGTYRAPAAFSARRMLMKTDTSGNQLWIRYYEDSTAFSSFHVDALPTSDGGVVCVGHKLMAGGNVAHLWKYDHLGNFEWQRIFQNMGSGFWPICRTQEGGYYMGGYTNSPTGSFPAGYLVKVDSMGDVYTSKVRGRIFADLNDNCIQDPGEESITGIIVEAAGTESFYTISDYNGNYELPLPFDSYTVDLPGLNPNWGHSTCATPPFSVVFTGAYQYDTLNIPLTPIHYCPDLWVDISTPFLRRCFTNTYQVSYCNFGTVSADSAYVEITFDPFMTVLSSSIPWSIPVVGNTYSFDVGDVGLGSNVAPFPYRS